MFPNLSNFSRASQTSLNRPTSQKASVVFLNLLPGLAVASWLGQGRTLSVRKARTCVQYSNTVFPARGLSDRDVNLPVRHQVELRQELMETYFPPVILQNMSFPTAEDICVWNIC